MWLKQKRRGVVSATALESEKEKNYLWATGAIRGSPALLKPRMPMHKKMLPVCSYLMLPSITFPAQIANNLIEYNPHAELVVLPRKNPRLSPSGVFVCNKLYVIATYGKRYFYSEIKSYKLGIASQTALAMTFEIRK